MKKIENEETFTTHIYSDINRTPFSGAYSQKRVQYIKWQQPYFTYSPILTFQHHCILWQRDSHKRPLQHKGTFVPLHLGGCTASVSMKERCLI